MKPAVPSLGPTVVTKYPVAASGNVAGLPIDADENRYFMKATETAQFGADALAALQKFAGANPNGGQVDFCTVTDDQTDGTGKVIDAFLSGDGEDGQPRFIYETREYVAPAVSYSVTLDGPTNTIAGTQAYGDIPGTGQTLEFVNSAGSYSFRWV